MDIVLYVVGCIGLFGALVTFANSYGQFGGEVLVGAAIGMALGSILIVGFGRVIQLLESINLRLDVDGPASAEQPVTGARVTALANPPPSVPSKHYRFGEIAIEAFSDGTYIAQEPGKPGERFMSKASLDMFLACKR